MLFQIVVVGLLMTGTYGRPQEFQSRSQIKPNGTVATIVKNTFVDNGDGNFHWEVETSDGFKAEQSGHTEPPSPNVATSNGNSTGSNDNPNNGGSEVIKGSYSYTAPNGQVISLSYLADKNGFQPIGSHIPTSPPNPFSTNPTQQHG